MRACVRACVRAVRRAFLMSISCRLPRLRRWPPLVLLQIPASQANTGNNHAISSMKYEIIEEFLALGWNVMLSDVDVVIVQVRWCVPWKKERGLGSRAP